MRNLPQVDTLCYAVAWAVLIQEKVLAGGILLCVVKVGRLWEIMMVLHMLLSRECKKNVTQGARGLDILS